MNGYWKTTTGNYYEGDQISVNDVAVPRRPDGTYVWNGVDGWTRNAQLGAPVDYAAFLGTPVQVVSAVAPTLNGVYWVDAQSQGFITSIADGIANGKGLPGGGQTFKYSDAQGQNHDFSSVNFLAFAKVIEDFVFAGFQEYHNRITGGQSSSFPSGPLDIA